MHEVLFSSKNMEWETPHDLYDRLNEEFAFTCDVAVSHCNHKHQHYFTAEIDGLRQPWQGVCWCNPPYGRNIGKWLKKAHVEAQNGVTTVMLIPARTDTKWFHEYIYGRYKIRFIKGRLKFNGSKDGAPFPSMIVIFAPDSAIKQQNHFPVGGTV